MKLTKWLFGALMLTIAYSCSSDEPSRSSNGKQEFRGDGYIAVNINLPQTRPTRAGNDNFDDGTENEYRVSNGVILLFTGKNESAAQFHSAYSLSGLQGDADADNDNITTTFTQVLQVNNITLDKDDSLYALVMLNYRGVGSLAGSDFTFNGDAEAFKGTFSDLQQKTIAAPSSFYSRQGESASDFFMTNAPLSSKPGGDDSPAGAAVSTLASLGKSVYKTYAEAEDAEAASIYVERGVAKATIKISARNVQFGDGDNESFPIVNEESKWSLSNVENSSFIVRNITDDFSTLLGYSSSKLTSPDYRFVGSAKIGTTSAQPAADFYRTYWCKDPKYSEDKDYDDAVSYTSVANALYCYENTFDVAHQNMKNSTRAVIKMVLKIGEKGTDGKYPTFYTRGDDKQTIYVSEADATSFQKQWLISSEVLKGAFTRAMRPGQTFSKIADCVSVTYEREAESGLLLAKDIAINLGENFSEDVFASVPALTDEEKATLISGLNHNDRIYAYENGEVYYSVLFQHFGDDQTPWSEPASGNTTYGVGEQADKDYLGRYGMVRNNWYDLDITKIYNIGSPVVPDADVTTPPDKTPRYLSFKINVLSWAKRTQQVDF